MGSLLIIKLLNVSRKSYFKEGNHLLFVTLTAPFLTVRMQTHDSFTFQLFPFLIRKPDPHAGKQ